MNGVDITLAIHRVGLGKTEITSMVLLLDARYIEVSHLITVFVFSKSMIPP